jgi:hypothetical protein
MIYIAEMRYRHWDFLCHREKNVNKIIKNKNSNFFYLFKLLYINTIEI